MGLIKETNEQYYAGSQIIPGDGLTTITSVTFNFETPLKLGATSDANSPWDPTSTYYALNNFKIYKSPTGLPGSFEEIITPYGVSSIENPNGTFDSTVNFDSQLQNGPYIACQLKSLSGGNFGQTESDKAYGEVVENNYGGYSYISLDDLIENYMVGYVGDGKIIQRANKYDIIFHAKRGLQEFSYDILKSVHSQELTIPASLSLPLPQDYVNYVSVCYIDALGVKRPLYPADNLTTSPYNMPVQDATGVPTQDNFGSNIEGTSITEKRWKKADDKLINQNIFNSLDDYAYWANYYGVNGTWSYGQFYGQVPEYAQVNGWFNMNEREGKIAFSSGLVNRLIVLQYISDGLAYDGDSKVPKLVEDALYSYISYALVSTRAGQQEFIVSRLKKEKRAKMRNAKIRLSNIKIDEFAQVMRGKSKWIKH
tara:strand:+ start:1629 stop:2903 length:1275 start_codon:yes stop_codon:yes gene_type:complete